MTPYAIEVIKRRSDWRVYTTVYGSPRETFTYKSEKAAVHKVQELERAGYTLLALPEAK